MRSTFLTGVCAMALLCPAADVCAQVTGASRAARPYRGLFGGGGANESEQSLTVSASMGAGVGNRLTRDDEPPVPGTVAPVRAARVTFGTLSGGLQYSLNRSRVGLGASLATSGRYTPGTNENYVGSHSGSIGASLALSRRAQLTASHSVAYQPYATLFGIPGLGDPGLGIVAAPDLNLGVAPSSQISQTTSASFTRSIGRDSSFAINYLAARVDLSSRPDDMRTTSLGARYTQGLGKGLGLRLGYGYVDRRFADGSADLARGHNIDIGLDFNRALSLSRRTSLTFGTGSSAIAYQDQTHFYLTGNATLRREIGRTWNASLSYRRGIDFVERFAEPLLSDSIGLALSGLVSRRWQFQSSGGVSFGSFGAGATASVPGDRQRTYKGSAGLTAALTRNMAIGMSYSYYRYHFANAAALPAGFLPGLNNQTARVYLSVWAPLLHRGVRSTDASR